MVSLEVKARDLSLLSNVQTGSGAHPAFCSVDTEAVSPGDKAART
jgi:hypothetical protein